MSASEAIQNFYELDCFVANAPRNDEGQMHERRKNLRVPISYLLLPEPEIGSAGQAICGMILRVGPVDGPVN
jgi:hypothetical protein